MMRATFAALALAYALAAPARAEVFKCVGPNGDIRFTSNAAQCPNAAPHTPRAAAVQRVERAQPKLASARPGAIARPRPGTPASPGGSGEHEATWRQKQDEAEHAVRSLEDAQARIVVAVRWCNKGHGVTTENPRTGMREQIRCQDVDAEHTKVEAELAKARAYLETGLDEECRQAGCLPGWIR